MKNEPQVIPVRKPSNVDGESTMQENEKEKAGVRTHADNLVIDQRVNTTIDEQSPSILCSSDVWLAVQSNFNVCVPIRRPSARSPRYIDKQPTHRLNHSTRLWMMPRKHAAHAARHASMTVMPHPTCVQYPLGVKVTRTRGDSQLPSAAAFACA